ncbi:MAG: hypothetical protein O2V44_09585 [Candidatus Bathyarchaeota archaeon]|jgi:hypothetical protein|nr:hypothetical protein [Candidatus Bathyarchaeota archaeon]
MKVKGSQAGWVFWLGWVAASTVGMFVGFMAGFFIAAFTELVLGFGLGDWSFPLVFGIWLGIGVGVLQWVVLWIFLELQSIGIGAGELKWSVLWQQVSRAGLWVLASIAACYGIVNSDFMGIAEPFRFDPLRIIGVVALGGAVAGILQWLVLRGQVSRAGWWVLACTVGWALGVTVAGAIPWGGDPELLQLGVTGAVMGVVTGGALVWLLRQPVPEAQLEE